MELSLERRNHQKLYCSKSTHTSGEIDVILKKAPNT